jgi:hypothetical protein
MYGMDMEMHHGHRQVALILTCSMDMDMQHGHGHAAWSWACSMYMDIQKGHGHGYTVWIWTCSIDMDMQNGQLTCIMDMYIHAAYSWTCNTNRYGNGHTAWRKNAARIRTCRIDIDMQHEIDTQHGYGHTA